MVQSECNTFNQCALDSSFFVFSSSPRLKCIFQSLSRFLRSSSKRAKQFAVHCTTSEIVNERVGRCLRRCTHYCFSSYLLRIVVCDENGLLYYCSGQTYGCFGKKDKHSWAPQVGVPRADCASPNFDFYWLPKSQLNRIRWFKKIRPAYYYSKSSECRPLWDLGLFSCIYFWAAVPDESTSAALLGRRQCSGDFRQNRLSHTHSVIFDGHSVVL